MRATEYVLKSIRHVNVFSPTAQFDGDEKKRGKSSITAFSQLDRKTYARLISFDCIYLIEQRRAKEGVEHEWIRLYVINPVCKSKEEEIKRKKSKCQTIFL